MITAYYGYIEAHESLFAAAGPEEFARAAKNSVELYLDNRGIWDELNHYKLHGTILGKHPVIYELSEIDKLRKLNSSQLSKRRSNLYINIQKTRKLISTGDKPELNSQRAQSIKTKERLLIEIDTILTSR